MSNLAKYSKKEIIDAVRFVSKYYSRYAGVENALLNAIEEGKRKKALDDRAAALDNELELMNNFFDWQNE